MAAVVVLVVDDDAALRRLVTANLQAEGHTVLEAASGHQAVAAVAAHHVDLAILDVGLPDLDGFTLCQRLRERSDLPILFLTGATADREKVRGLRVGADDYVTKPFHPEELLARVEAIFRRIRPRKLPVAPGVQLDVTGQQLLAPGGTVELTPREYRLVHLLLQAGGRPLPRHEILAALWDAQGAEEIQTKAVEMLVSRLRKKLAAARLEQLILTVPGEGIQLQREGPRRLPEL